MIDGKMTEKINHCSKTLSHGGVVWNRELKGENYEKKIPSISFNDWT
tara:strand:- start:259 stop:399 length:141 start_codon:yes stop_codon:yes gene_type:complete